MHGRSSPGQLQAERVESRRSRFGRARRANARHVADLQARPLQVATFGCDPLADLEPQAIGLTYWFEPVADGVPTR